MTATYVFQCRTNWGLACVAIILCDFISNKMLICPMIVDRTKQVEIGRCEIGTVRRIVWNFPTILLQKPLCHEPGGLSSPCHTRELLSRPDISFHIASQNLTILLQCYFLYHSTGNLSVAKDSMDKVPRLILWTLPPGLLTGMHSYHRFKFT